MMEEKELIGKIRGLRQIKPNRDWVSLTKSQILGEEKIELTPFSLSSVGYCLRLILGRRMAYLGLVVIFILFGLLGFAQNSLPGDPLYSIKKITERAQTVFVAEEDLPRVQLELADKRLEELARVAQENRVKNLSSAINETKASISEANKNLAKASSPAEVKKIVDEIEEKAQVINQTLGVAFGEEEIGELRQNSDKLYAEYLISDLETRTLTEEQQEILEEAKELYEAGDYSGALEKILILSY